MVKINLIKGLEFFEPGPEAEPVPAPVLEGEEELGVLDHLLKRNQEGKMALAESLLELGFPASAVDRILGAAIGTGDECSEPNAPAWAGDQDDFLKEGGFRGEALSVSRCAG